MRSRTWAIGAGLLLAAAGCGGSAGHARPSNDTSNAGTASTVGTGPPGTARRSPTTVAPATSTTIDTSVVPAVITVPYVNAVLAQLDHVYGNAVRLVVQTGTIPPAAIADLRAIYMGQQYQDELQIFSLQLVNGFKQVKPDPGDRVLKVEKFIALSRTCIYAEVIGNYDALSTTSIAPAVSYIVLESIPLATNSLDPTAWEFSYEMTNPPATSYCG